MLNPIDIAVLTYSVLFFDAPDKKTSSKEWLAEFSGIIFIPTFSRMKNSLNLYAKCLSVKLCCTSAYILLFSRALRVVHKLRYHFFLFFDPPLPHATTKNLNHRLIFISPQKKNTYIDVIYGQPLFCVMQVRKKQRNCVWNW